MAVLADPLLRKWLPQAPAAEVKALATHVNAGLAPDQRARDLRTKPACVAFLQERRRTSKFLGLLRGTFLRCHRTSEPRPVRSTVTDLALGPVILQGETKPPVHEPYPHQIEARCELDKLLGQGVDLPAGLVVLPTGAGKTETMVMWLLDRMEADRDLRVLWLAHQQELLLQAIGRFQEAAAERGPTFRRRARLFFAGASKLTVLVEEDLDIAAATIQTLGHNFDRLKRAKLQKFLARPTIVVVDEAHRGAAPTYKLILDEVAAGGARALVGLTATPYPSSPGAATALRGRFPSTVVKLEQEPLIAQGILARPVLHTVRTGERIEMSDAEITRAEAQDFPNEVLDRLDTLARNHLIRDTYVENRAEWSKTLLFASHIEHADTLYQLLLDAGARARVLHSRAEEGRADTLQWFRDTTDDAVLVSVGMLNEGVDLPDATTAFLARPTASRILLRQMIGRVLRGPRAGGSSDAHIVHFHDYWANFADVLEPRDVVHGVRRTLVREDGVEQSLPEILDADDQPIDPEVLAAAERAYLAAAQIGPLSAAEAERMRVISPLVGYYELPDRKLPVFEHQRDGYDELVEWALAYDELPPYLSFFDDAPPPYPTKRTLNELVAYAREFEATPPWVPIADRHPAAQAADRILAAGALTEDERAKIMEDAFATSTASILYPGLLAFEEAVEEDLRERRRRRFRPEQPPAPSAKPRLRRLPRVDRDLGPATKLAIRRAGELLPNDLRQRLDHPPPVAWTHKVVQPFGTWRISLYGASRGRQSIRINRLLRTEEKMVSDEMLAYLIYHELLHHLLPGQGHDAEFRELEALWPDAASLDLAFDTLHERWETRPAKYLGLAEP